MLERERPIPRNLVLKAYACKPSGTLSPSSKLCPGSVIIRSDEQSAKIGVSGRRAMRRKAKERRASAIRKY